MKKIDDKISEKVTSLVTEYICSSFEVLKNNELWKKAIKKACEATEGVDDSFADYIIKSPAIQRHFVWIMGNKSLNDLYRSFILTIAVERCAFNDEKKLAISLGMAILDNWFELNNEDSLEGMTWETMPPDAKRLLKRARIGVNIILTENSIQSQYELFQRLNTGGVKLESQEIRNCLIIMLDESVYERINELKSYENFKKCLTLTEDKYKVEYHAGKMAKDEEKVEELLSYEDVQKLKDFILIMLDYYAEVLVDYTDHEYYLIKNESNRLEYEEKQEKNLALKLEGIERKKEMQIKLDKID